MKGGGGGGQIDAPAPPPPNVTPQPPPTPEKLPSKSPAYIRVNILRLLVRCKCKFLQEFSSTIFLSLW